MHRHIGVPIPTNISIGYDQQTSTKNKKRETQYDTISLRHDYVKMSKPTSFLCII